MTIYAIGDVQGCYQALRGLLKKIRFDPNHDQLWFTGDLVHRGGQSLETLRFIYSIRDSVQCVLGNHDLHLIAAFNGFKLLEHGSDLVDIIRAPDGEKLVNWLRQQPLLHCAHNYALVHAGIAPTWTLHQSQQLAQEVEQVLRSNDYPKFLAQMYGNKPALWNDNLTGMDRLRCITNYFTRMRFVNHQGKLNFSESGTTDSLDLNQKNKLLPWFKHPALQDLKTPIIFGHWAALRGKTDCSHAVAIDTGFVWGGQLSAYNLQSKKITQYG